MLPQVQPMYQVLCVEGLHKMGRASTIDQLPADIIEILQDLLRDPRVSQLNATKQINAIIEQTPAVKPISKSAVNRYAMKMEKVGAKLREAREISKMYIDRFGEDNQGSVGKVVNEMVRTLVFDLTMKLQQETLGVDDAPELAKMIKNLADSMSKLEHAASLNTKREQEIKKQAAEDLAKKAEKASKNGSITPEQLRKIIKEAYGA